MEKSMRYRFKFSSGRMIYTCYYYNTVLMYALQLPIPLTYFPATKAYPLPAHCTSVISCSPSTIHVSYLPTRGVFITYLVPIHVMSEVTYHLHFFNVFRFIYRVDQICTSEREVQLHCSALSGKQEHGF